jgi:hypothetical protein
MIVKSLIFGVATVRVLSRPGVLLVFNLKHSRAPTFFNASTSNIQQSEQLVTGLVRLLFY